MTANKTSFQKGQSGNPAGKRLGSRHHASRVLDELMDGEGEAITRKAIEAAKAGNPVALRLCLERLMPARKDRLIAFTLPPIETTGDLTRATGALLAAVADGELTPSEAAELGKHCITAIALRWAYLPAGAVRIVLFLLAYGCALEIGQNFVPGRQMLSRAASGPR